MKGAHQGVVVLDRDGTLVIDRGYLDDPDGLEFQPGAVEGLRSLHAGGWRLVVISNQSGVGRGFFPIERVEAMNERLHAMARDIGVGLEAIYCCPHAPDAGCGCRKPSLGLMRRATSELGFDPRQSVVIGDKDTDIEFGRRAGATTILIADAASAGPWKRVVPDLIARDLTEAARALAPRAG